MAKSKPIKINPNKIKSRDLLMVKLINGATKANIALDHRKESNRNECRDYDSEEYYDEECYDEEE
jgi:hypothetical protein